MAIQIPSAAGFIPNESVLDAIGKYYSMFTQQGKDKKAADLDYLKSQTGLNLAQAASVPIRTANDTKTTNANVGYVGAQTLALPQKTANETQTVKNDTTRVGNQQEQFNKNYEEGQREFNANDLFRTGESLKNDMQRGIDNINKDKEFAIQGQQLKLNEKSVQQQGDYSEQQIKAKRLGDLIDVYKATALNPNASDARQQIEYQIMREFSPQAAEQMIAHAKRIEAIRQETQQRAGVKKSSYTEGLPTYEAARD